MTSFRQPVSLPPIFPLLVSVMLGILAGQSSTPWIWLLIGSASVVLVSKNRLWPWPFLFGIACLAALRFHAVREERARDPLRFPARATKIRKGEIAPVGETSPWRRLPEKVHQQMKEWLVSSMPAPWHALAMGVFFGDRQEIPHEVLRGFQVTGTSHLLVASGSSVALVWGLAWLLCFRLWFQARMLASGLAVLFYVLMLSPDPPVLRAALMAVCGLLGILTGRGRDSVSALFLSAFVLLLADPGWLFDPGFQLSFLSVLGILFLFQPLSARLSFLPGWGASSLALTLSAQIPILVPVAFHFHTLSLVSPLSNLLAVPLCGLSMFLTPLSFCASLIWRPLGLACSFWHVQILTLLWWAVKGASRFPLAYVWVKSPGLLTSFLFYLALLGWWGWLSGGERGRWLCAASLVLLLVIWVSGIMAPSRSEISFLDVGQGDAIFFRTDGKTTLVDGGGNGAAASFLRNQGVNRIDGILLTHPHRDHLEGLIPILEEFKVKRVWFPPVPEDPPLLREFIEEAGRRGVPLFQVQGGERIRLAASAWFEVIWPIPPLLAGTRSDLNNNSAVVRVHLGSVTVLLSGDIEEEGEQMLMTRLHAGNLLQSQILKVPHHGSATSSIHGFLKVVSPEVAVVSVGRENRFGHPSPETIRRLEKSVPCLFRTDRDGTVRFRLDSGPWGATLRRLP